MVECFARDDSFAKPAEEEQRPFWSLEIKMPVTTGMSQTAKVCPGCGLLLTFVKDPSIFRNKDVRNLPRTADHSAADTSTLPRTSDEQRLT